MTGTSACGGNDRDVVASRTTTICAPGFGRGPWPTMVAFPVDAAGVSAGAASCTGGGAGFEQPAASASVASSARRLRVAMIHNSSLYVALDGDRARGRHS